MPFKLLTRLLALAAFLVFANLLLYPFQGIPARVLLQAKTTVLTCFFAFLDDLLSPLAFSLAAVLFISSFKQPTIKDVGFRFHPSDFLFGSAAFLFSFLPLFFLPASTTYFFHLSRYVTIGPTWPVILTQIAATFFIAFGEELFFRGVLQNLLTYYFFPVLAVILTSATFGVLHCLGHWSFSRFAFATILGLALSFTYRLTKRLSTPILVHAAANAALLAAAWFRSA
jgi:membrane protease YdiL (CAAX protease family)